jgi:ATP-dependent DNA helicase RecG
MTRENQQIDQKSLRRITGHTADWSALAADCVCFANASGGCLRIGVEDGEVLPPATQRIPTDLLDLLRKDTALEIGAEKGAGVL